SRGPPLPPRQDLVAPAPIPKIVPRESVPRTTPAPQLTCTRVWRCDEYDDCAWKSVCKPRPEPVAAPAPAPTPAVRYESPRPPAAVPQVRPAPRLQPVVLAPAPAIDSRSGNPLILLGQRLFHDTRLSRTGTTACAVCHIASYGYAQPRRVAQMDNGQLGTRNVPSIINASLLPALMWDGRFRSLEQQVFGPFSTGEMGIDVAEAVRRLSADREYVYLF